MPQHSTAFAYFNDTAKRDCHET